MNILLCGNSHLAPFKQAWQTLAADQTGLTVDFLARPQGRGGLQELSLHDGALTGWQTPGSGFMASRRDISPATYDAFVLIGMTPMPANIGCFSAQLQKCYAAQFLSSSHNAFSALAALLRQASSAPIIFVPHPFAVSDGGTSGREKSTPSEYHQAMQTFCARWMQARNLLISPQPVETLHPDRLASKPEFLLRPDNAQHLNAAYGHIHLAALLQLLRSHREG